MGMEDILKSLLEGAAQQQSSRGRGSANDPVAELLEGILGGAIQGQRSSSSTGGGLEDILGSILGGGQQSQRGQSSAGGGLEDILGGILGGGSSSAGASSPLSGLLAPIANALAQKLGLPPAVAETVVGFVLNKLLASRVSGASSAADQGLNLDGLLESMSEGGVQDTSYFSQSGLTQELAQKTGLDPQTAERSLAEALSLLGGQVKQVRRTRPSNQPAPGGLDHLLDEWD